MGLNSIECRLSLRMLAFCKLSSSLRCRGAWVAAGLDWLGLAVDGADRSDGRAGGQRFRRVVAVVVMAVVVTYLCEKARPCERAEGAEKYCYARQRKRKELCMLRLCTDASPVVSIPVCRSSGSGIEEQRWRMRTVEMVRAACRLSKITLLWTSYFARFRFHGQWKGERREGSVSDVRKR